MKAGVLTALPAILAGVCCADLIRKKKPQQLMDGKESKQKGKLVTQESLQKAIIEDMMPTSSSTRCVSPSWQTFSSFDFTSSQSESNWYEGGQHGPYSDLEQYVFLAKMTHIDSNKNRTWTIRLGKAGNMYSFVGPMGETVAPQKRSDSPWVDEVWQAVSVDLTSHDPQTRNPYFIHEAGSYQGDTAATGYDKSKGVPLTHVPFYSPSLGNYCDDDSGECGFVSWGQQGHVPTDFSSGLLYFSRYKDCGDGVFEYTTLRHNNVGNPDTLDYLNVPWGGVRASVLHDLVLSHNVGSSPEIVEPIPDWAEGSVMDIGDTLGYTIFAQDLPPSSQTEDGAPYNLPDGLSLTVGMEGCSENALHSDIWGKLTMRCHLVQTIDLGSKGTNDAVRIIGDGGEVLINGVVHWAYKGSWLYFWPTTASSSEVVGKLSPGSQLGVTHVDRGKPASDNLAIGHVFGTDNNKKGVDPGGVSKTNTFLRWGSTNRDYTAYAVISRPRIEAGDTYFYRQYFMVDSYEEMAATGTKFSQETKQDLYSATNGPPGRTIALVADRAISGTFGAVVEDSYSGRCTSVCTGSTTPKPNYQALFQIKCGASHVISNDPYHFSPAGNPRRAYICEGMPSERPEWTLLGFFTADECSIIASSRYDPDHCM